MHETDYQLIVCGLVGLVLIMMFNNIIDSYLAMAGCTYYSRPIMWAVDKSRASLSAAMVFILLTLAKHRAYQWWLVKLKYKCDVGRPICTFYDLRTT